MDPEALYHVFITIDHDRHEVRVFDDGRHWSFYMPDGQEPAKVMIDVLGPIVEFRRVESAEVL